MKEIANLSGLKSLSLDRTRISDAGLKELAGLKNLRYLDLSDTEVTDAGLKDFGRVVSLQMLILPNTKVTDAGMMASLQRKRRLIQLKDLADLEKRTLFLASARAETPAKIYAGTG